MIGSRCVYMIARVLLLAFTLAGIVVAAELGSNGRVSIVRVPNGGEAADAKLTSDGTIHLLYNSDDIPYYVKSSDYGATFSLPIPVVDKESRKPGLVFSGSAMAVGQ